MVGAFPVFKLGTLALKQISKPIVNFLKQRARSNLFYRRYICLPPAQRKENLLSHFSLVYHLWETRLKLRILGLSKPKKVIKLSEDAAAELGAEMLGELIMFTFGSVILFYEYRRQSKKEVDKEEKMQSNLDTLTSEVNELYTLIEIQDAKIRELTRLAARDIDGCKSPS